MKTARERTRAAYVGPLQDGVDALGRIVFGPSFQVCIDESLAIESRTLSGKTIPLASLSAGTREQLAVILRLACATVVASDGGVPVILDDVLGYSDPRRLEADFPNGFGALARDLRAWRGGGHPGEQEPGVCA